MANQAQNTEATRQEASKRQERANRILDAAETLILRLGYNKTTIDDISRQAGVAKGTIYLHWKTREELFEALVHRENARWLADFNTRISADAEGASLRSVLKHSALALMKRPLLMALTLRDTDVIGKLAQSPQSNAVAIEKVTGFKTYLEFLREHQLVRTDLDIRAQIYILSAVFMGFFVIAPLLPDDLKVPDEELASLLAETVHRTLEPNSANSPDATASPSDSQAATHNFMQFLNRYRTVVQEQSERDGQS